MEEKIFSLLLSKKELSDVEKALSILTNAINFTKVLHPCDYEEVIKPTVKTTPASEEQIRVWQDDDVEIINTTQHPTCIKTVPVLEEQIRELELYQNILSSKSALENNEDDIPEPLSEEESSHRNQQDEDSTNAMTQCLKHINELSHKGMNIDLIELSKIKDLHPDLQLFFKDYLRWDIVIQNTFNIREDILVDLFTNMSEENITFMSASQNISDRFILRHPDLIDWSALLTFNRTPSEKVLFNCFKYIPKQYKSNAYKHLICREMFESSRPYSDEEK